MCSVNLSRSHSDDTAPDPIDAAPEGSHVFVDLRGVTPLAGNDTRVHNPKGFFPGITTRRVITGGMGGGLVGIAGISNLKEGKEPADADGIAVRKLIFMTRQFYEEGALCVG